ncbi:MAG: hypothetical protein ACHQ7N_08370 [Candidatus Methylomirabilales bacterium]
MSTPEQFEDQKNEMLADAKGPLWNENDPRHKGAVRKFTKLTEQQLAADPATAPPPASEKALIELPEEGSWNVAEVNRHVGTLERFGFTRAETQDLLKGMTTKAKAIATGKAEMPDPAATEATLKEDWKGDFGRKALASRLFVATLPEQTRQMLNLTGLGDDVTLIRRAAAAGEKLLPLHDRKQQIEADPDFFMGRPGSNPERNKALAAEWNTIKRQLVEGPDKA